MEYVEQNNTAKYCEVLTGIGTPQSVVADFVVNSVDSAQAFLQYQDGKMGDALTANNRSTITSLVHSMMVDFSTPNAAHEAKVCLGARLMPALAEKEIAANMPEPSSLLDARFGLWDKTGDDAGIKYAGNARQKRGARQ